MDAQYQQNQKDSPEQQATKGGGKGSSKAMIWFLFIALILIILGVAVRARAQTSLVPTRDTATVSSAGVATFRNDKGDTLVSFEYIITGSPDSNSTVMQGCMNGGTCETLETSTTNTNAIHKYAGSANAPVYDYFTITPTFVNGTAPKLKINRLSIRAAIPSGGSGTTINATLNTIPKRTSATTFGDSALLDSGTTVTSSEPILLPAGTNTAPALAFSAETNLGFYMPAGHIVCLAFLNDACDIQLNGHLALTNAGVFKFSSSSSNAQVAADTGMSRVVAGLTAMGNGTQGDASGIVVADGQAKTLTADWTCGTGGTVASCATAQIVGSTTTPLTFTLPLVARAWTLDCDLVVGQATAATANQWNLLTATNGATNTMASYSMNTAATAFTGGAITGQAASTTTFQITPSWTLGGINTKMPAHIHARIEGASVSGTVLSLQLLAPTVADLVTIYRGSGCYLHS